MYLHDLLPSDPGPGDRCGLRIRALKQSLLDRGRGLDDGVEECACAGRCEELLWGEVLEHMLYQFDSAEDRLLSSVGRMCNDTGLRLDHWLNRWVEVWCQS